MLETDLNFNLATSKEFFQFGETFLDFAVNTLKQHELMLRLLSWAGIKDYPLRHNLACAMASPGVYKITDSHRGHMIVIDFAVCDIDEDAFLGVKPSFLFCLCTDYVSLDQDKEIAGDWLDNAAWQAGIAAFNALYTGDGEN